MAPIQNRRSNPVARARRVPRADSEPALLLSGCAALPEWRTNRPLARARGTAIHFAAHASFRQCVPEFDVEYRAQFRASAAPPIARACLRKDTYLRLIPA